MTTPLDDFSDLEAWTKALQGWLGYANDPELLESFDWSSINKLTVGNYLSLLDYVEDFLRSFDWSFLSAQLPLIQQYLPPAQANEILAFFNDLIAGNFSFITQGFDYIRDYLAPFAASTLLVDALSGKGTPGTGGGDDGTAGSDDLVGSKGSDDISGKGGNDDIDGRGGADKLSGGKGADTVKGGGGGDTIFGGAGGDKLYGNGGADRILGNAGADLIRGGAGQDVITGGGGDDWLFGNKGGDRFVFKGRDGTDKIMDFKVGVDLIRIEGADRLGDLSFTKRGDNMLIEFGDLDIIVRDVTRAEIADADNFLF